MRHWRTWNRSRPQSAPARLIDRFAGSLDPALALLFEEASAARIVVDRHGNLVRASDVLWRMVGMAAALAPGAPLLALFVPGGREAIWQELGPLLRGQVGGEPLRPLSAELISGGAEPLAVSIAVAALREADGATGGALLSVRDIGPEVRLQAQLTQSQRLQAMGQLTGGVAHDFKNLLTAILGAADAVAAHVGLDGEAREDLEQIRATAARGTALVQKLLAFSRRETLQPQVLEVNEVVSGIAALLRRLLGSRIRLELKLEQPGSRVRADPTALDQVLMNLAMNARDRTAARSRCAPGSSRSSARSCAGRRRSRPAATCCSRCGMAAWASPPTCCRISSSPSIRRGTTAAAPDSGSQPCTASSVSQRASWTWRARLVRGPACGSTCRAGTTMPYRSPWFPCGAVPRRPSRRQRPRAGATRRALPSRPRRAARSCWWKTRPRSVASPSGR